MSTAFERRCKDLVAELGLGSAAEDYQVIPLSGGVSSEIAAVDLGDRKICVKFALEQLKVAEQWFANIERGMAEYGWLRFAATIVPEAVPELLGCSRKANGFAMEFIEGEDTYLWKETLLAGKVKEREAISVGTALGKIHQASAREEVLTQFQNQSDFHSLRLEPYLLFTGSHHPQLAGDLNGLVTMLTDHEKVLVHGDVSPKNIIFRKDYPVFLDAECATAGDPAFDLAFCLNHLVLKAIHLRYLRRALLSSVNAFWSGYREQVVWEQADALEQRVCRLLPALMLARVDGKSPVEYLNEKEQQHTRSVSIPLITAPVSSLTDFTNIINTYLEEN